MALQEWWKNPALSGAFGNSPQPETKEAMPQPIGGKYGYTGKGPDGVAQPDRRVAGMGNGGYDTHEAEFVVDADTTQAIGPDILNAMQTSVKTGKPPDLNKIREALGIPAKEGYQEGGLTSGVPEAKKPVGGMGKDAATVTKSNEQDFLKQSGGTNTTKDTTKALMNKGFKDSQSAINTPPNISVAPIPTPGDIIQPDTPIQDINIQPDTITPPNISVAPIPTPGDIIQPDTPIQDINIQPDTTPTEDDAAIEYMKKIMGGDNPYFEQLKNMYSQDIGGAGAASAAAMRQQATQAGMSPEQIASMSATFGRDSQQSVSNMLGTLALGQSEMQYQAAKDIFGMEMEKKQFEFAKEKYGDSKANQVLIDVNGGMSLKMLQEKYPDMNITQEDYDKMWDASQMGWQQEVFNQQMDFAKEQYGDLEGQRIANLVNAGWSLEQLQKEFPDKNITQEDYDQMQSYSNMGFQKEQWEYSKKVDSFNQLMQQGGEKNFQNAAKLFNSMFGTQVDFSNALTEENKVKFNESWNNMTGAIAGNMTFEDWKNSAIADGTYDSLNMTDADIKTMYENMQLSNNPTYQALTQYDKMLEKGVFTQEQYDRVTKALKYGITHPEGFTFSDGFQILDKGGKEVEYFKTQEEADEFLTNNPDHTLNIEKEGWVEYGGGSGTGPGGDPNNNISNAMDYFDSIGVITDEGRISEFLDAHGGAVPDGFTKKMFDEWDQTTGSNSRINEYFSGGGAEPLTSADQKMLDEIRAAQARVDSGEGTDDDEKLLDSMNFTLSSKSPLDFENPEVGNSGEVSFYSQGHGVLHMNYSYPTNIYDASYNKNQAQKKQAFPKLRFKSEMKEYFDNNKGRKWEYDGNVYEIVGVTTRKIHTDPITGKQWEADVVEVIGPDGTTEYIDFGTNGSITD